MEKKLEYARLILLVGLLAGAARGIAPCDPLEQPDVCGYYPSDYAALNLTGVPVLCEAQCDIGTGFDRCGVCNGTAYFPDPELLLPTSLSPNARLGGSVACWNGTVAAAQHIAQEYTALVNVPVVTWNWDGAAYTEFVLPWSTDGTTTGLLPLGLGYGLALSANYLAVGSHATTPRVIQLWARTAVPAWSWEWTANDPCPGNYFGFAMAVDERIPKGAHHGVYGTVAAGDPAAYLSGRVYIYMTYDPGILQTLYYGFGNETDRACFGESVSADSGYLAVGSPSFTYAAQSKSGSVFVYLWDPSLGVQGEYAALVQIPPPVPAVNGGFGESVAVWENFVAVGDNQRAVYLYEIVGVSAIPIPVDQPAGINLASRLGYTVTMWEAFLAAGDEDYIPSPSTRGATFVWTQDPLLSILYLGPQYVLTSDATTDLATRYGAAVSMRGGCILASGAPQQGPRGGVYVVDLCRADCYGCDAVLNSCVADDACGVCGGDNSTCMDCTGVVNGTVQVDACAVCGGNNRSCVLPDPASLTLPCNTSASVNLTHAFQAQFGAATWTVIAPLPTKGAASVSGSTLTYAAFPYEFGGDTVTLNATLFGGSAWGVLTATITLGSCTDCNGVLNGPARLDDCNVCEGDNSTCLGCDGVPNSGQTFDFCGDCGGHNTTCLVVSVMPSQTITCTAQVIFLLAYEPTSTPVSWSVAAGPLVGTVFVNPSNGYVVWTNPGVVGVDWFVVQATSLTDPLVYDSTNVTFQINDCSDCSGEQLGTQLLDLCGVCGGNSLECADCFGIPNGGAVRDVCGDCNGAGTRCLGCDGVPNSGKTFDLCLVCGGDNTSCAAPPSAGSIVIIAAGLVMLGIALLWLALSWFFRWRHYPRARYQSPPKPPPGPVYVQIPSTNAQSGISATRTPAADPYRVAQNLYGPSTVPLWTQS